MDLENAIYQALNDAKGARKSYEAAKKSAISRSTAYQYAKDKVDYFFRIGEDWKGNKGSKKTSFKIFTNREELYESAKELINENTVILVKGSRSTRMDVVADLLKI